MLGLPVSLVPGFIALVAKLSSAKTLDMRTAHFPLNRLPAFGAFPSIVLDPTVISVLRVQKILPPLYILARSWFMRLLPAFEAVEFPARTGHQAKLHHVVFRAEVRALIIRTAADIFVLKSIVNKELPTVQFRQLRGYIVDKSY